MKMMTCHYRSTVLMYSGKYRPPDDTHRLLSFTMRLLLIVSRRLIYTFTNPRITAVWCFPLVSSWFDNVVKFTLSFLAPLIPLNHALSPCIISAVAKHNICAHNEIITIFLWRKRGTCRSTLSRSCEKNRNPTEKRNFTKKRFRQLICRTERYIAVMSNFFERK